MPEKSGDKPPDLEKITQENSTSIRRLRQMVDSYKKRLQEDAGDGNEPERERTAEEQPPAD